MPTTSRERSPSEGKVKYSWNKVDKLCLNLVEQIKNNFKKYERVVGILSGGVIPSSIIAYHLGIKDIKFIDPTIYTLGEFCKLTPLYNTIFIDDVIDTGKTYFDMTERLLLDCDLAVLIQKPWAIPKPLYFAEETSSWIQFPWEIDE